MAADKQQLANTDWQRVRCPKFHALGNMIARLEDQEAGIETTQGKQVRGDALTEPMLSGERLACLRGRIGLVMRVLMLSLQAVLECKPQHGDEVEVCTLVLVSGQDSDVQWGINRARERALEEVRKN